MKARRVRLGNGFLRHIPIPRHRTEGRGKLYCGKTGKFIDVPNDNAMDCPPCLKGLNVNEPGLL